MIPPPLTLPARTLPARAGPWPVAVLVHGGFWRAGYGRDLMDPLAADLAARGYAVANLEYRRGDEGGWPATFLDVAEGIDGLGAAAAPLDLGRVVLVGHSAGGQLALWAVRRRGLPPPAVAARAIVALAGVCDLAAGAREGIGEGAVAAFLGGGPDELPERYALASPLAALPLGVRQLLVHPPGDDRVPITQSRSYAAAAAAAGDPVELLEVAGGHRTLIDPASDAWRQVAARLPGLLA